MRQQASSPVFLRRNLVILNSASPRFTSQFSAASAPSGSDACRSNRQEQRKGGLKFAFRTRVRTMLIVVYCPPCDASAVQQKHMPYTPRTLLSCLPSCYVALPSCPHAFCLALVPPCFLPEWSRSPLKENAVNENAAVAIGRGFASAPCAAYYSDGVPLMKKLSRACCVEHVRHTFITLPS